MSVSSFNTAFKELKESNIELVCAKSNLVDDVWAEDKPAQPKAKVWHLEEKYTGMKTEEKYAELSSKLKDSNHCLITTLDDIAWFLNLRGDDISYNPLFFSYLIFNNKQGSLGCTLFVDQEKIGDVADYLKSINVEVKPYEGIKEFIENMP